MPRHPEHSALDQDTPPHIPGNRLFCHQEFLEKMEENRSNTVGRRASLLMHRLHVNLSRPYYKATQGDNRGWRRSPLGGNHGSHFYAWWAPRGAAPLADNAEFDAAGEGSVFLRDIRHHDDHRPLNPQSLNENYLPIGLKELRHEDYVPGPWTQPQARFADARQKIRIIKGSPGSGKTTALWHAADISAGQAILYITYSNELAALAREHFDRFVPGNKRVHVATYSQLLREILKSDAPFQPLRRARSEFVKEVSGFSATILGPWLNEKGALYDEMHAHLIGGSLPVAVGRFPGFPDRRITARQYRDLREQFIGRAAAEAVVEIAETLQRRGAHPMERFFAELDMAWTATHEVRTNGAGPLADFDCIALDEAQDLTPIEALLVVELAARAGRGASLLVAGDEAQTVRPTDFEWGWFQDLIHARIASPQDYKLQVNLRSPVRIATLVNRVWDLYGNIAKQERPSGSGAAEIDENAGDQVILCTAKSGPELDELLRAFSEREGLAIITPGDDIPAYVPAELHDRVLTSFEAKGLDFQSVCVLDAGRWLDRVLQARERGRGLELENLSKRVAIDQMRVVLSRPSERIFWLDVNPNDRILGNVREMLSFYGDRAYPVVPDVLLKTLEEETLDVEERVLLCERDARQLLEVRPAMAWSRARQAVALLGELGGKFSVNDNAARRSAQMVLCQTALTLAMRRVPLPSEMGRTDLFQEAISAATMAIRPELMTLVASLAAHERNYSDEKTSTMIRLAECLNLYRTAVEPWLLLELQPRAAGWLQILEDRIDQIPDVVHPLLPPLYDLFTPLEAAEKKARLQERALRALLHGDRFALALKMLHEMPDAAPKLIAQCHEGLGEMEQAAAEYLRAGSPNDALRCYREIPDFDKALELVDRLGAHPAKDSLHWIRRMRDLAAERPQAFTKVIIPPEKKLLEQILETSLGASRKKPGKRAAPKKPAAPRKKAAPKPPRKEYF
jgi:tetratricopeptide (TPR) repeat protein